MYQVLSHFVVTNNLIFELLVSLAIAFVTAWLISVLYKRTHRGLNYEHSFISSLVLVAPIVTTIMFFIQGDLVLSLGLVGSLSIIRFRTPIKDTRDMVFLFWSIATGLGAGTYNWLTVGVASLFIGIVVIILYLLQFDRVQHSDYVLVLSGNEPCDSVAIGGVVGSYSQGSRIRSRETDEEVWEIVFELSFKRPADVKIDSMLEQLRSIDGVTRVSLLAPQLALPM